MNSAGPEDRPRSDDEQLPTVVRQLGTDVWYLHVLADGSAVGWWDWAQPPLRKPIRFDRTADGGLVPRDRGKRRERFLHEVGWILDQVGPFHPDDPHAPTEGEFVGSRGRDKIGRPPGTGSDRTETRLAMAAIRAENPGKSATWCYDLVKKRVGLASDTVLDHLYKPEPVYPHPVCALRPVNPLLPWERDWASWEADLLARVRRLEEEVAQQTDGKLSDVEVGLAQLRADMHELVAARAHADLAQVIHNARLLAYTMDTLVADGCSGDDVKGSLSLLACTSDEIDEIYELGKACDAAEPDAPLYVPPQWFDKVRQYLPGNRSW